MNCIAALYAMMCWQKCAIILIAAAKPANCGPMHRKQCHHSLMETFNDLKLIESLQRALVEVGYTRMTPVQAASLPAVLEGRDVIAQAQTGSGKTAAFALGLLNSLDADAVKLQGLVLCPTRELADQVSREIRRLARFIPNVKVLTLCGGVPLRAHLSSLSHEPHIVVGTPGRLLDLIRRGSLPLKAISTVVLDEADRMLDMGFLDAMRDIVRRVPDKRRTLLFSATIPDEIRAISRDFQRDAVAVTIEGEKGASPIRQVFIQADSSERVDVVAQLLRTHQPETAVVFCNMKASVRDTATALRQRGFAVLALHGDLDQREREEMLVQFANRSATVLVATDVAARGLDISELAMVINLDIANDPDTHLHRIGRTGRAGMTGIAVTLVGQRQKHRAEQIEQRLGHPLDWQPAPGDTNTDKVKAPQPGNITLAIDGGKTDKMRPGDILGALTGDAGVPGDAVGKIDIFPTRSYVAIRADWVDRAVKHLRDGRIKNRRFRIRKLGY
jgi:ATP-independent RNA helicase DbpA